jgi:predicted cupin superfamily sugar epimerase
MTKQLPGDGDGDELEASPSNLAFSKTLQGNTAMTSTIDSSLPPLKPVYAPKDSSAERKESPKLAKLISTLALQQHIEGGYFVETDRDTNRVPNPFLNTSPSASSTEQTTFYTSTGAVSANLDNKLIDADKSTANTEQGSQDKTRNASTSIHYLLTPESPMGAFHRNRGRTVHTLHRGRGRYVIIHADEVMSEYDSHSGVKSKARVETFIVGQNVEKGEKLQWIVDGGKYKSSFLLPLEGEEVDGNGGLLISETVVPGFEYSDHDFMRVERLDALVTKEQADEMRWMLRKDDKTV